MASNALRTTFSKFQTTSIFILRNPKTSRVYQGSCSRDWSSSAYDNAAGAAKTGANEAMKVGKDVKDHAACGAQDVAGKAKDAAGHVSGSAHELTDKAKQTAQDAWGSVKDTTQKMKDAMAGKADDSKEEIKEHAETITRSMNSKN